MLKVNRDFFTVYRSLVVFFYVVLVFCNKSFSLLKNIAIVKNSSKGKYSSKLFVYTAASLVSCIKSIIIVPVEIDFIKERIFTVHDSLMDLLAQGGSRKEAGDLLAEKEKEKELSELRIRYAKKYLLYISRSIAIMVLISSISYKVLIVTVLFLAGDLFVKKRIQRIEETGQTVHLNHIVEQDRIYSQISLEKRSCEENNSTDKLRKDHRKSALLYRNRCIYTEAQRSFYTIIGLILFYLYAGVAVAILYKDGPGLTQFIAVFKKIEKLTNYFLKMF